MNAVKSRFTTASPPLVALPLTAHCFFPTTHGRTSRVHAATIFNATFVTGRPHRFVQHDIDDVTCIVASSVAHFFSFYASYLRVSVTCRAFIRASAQTRTKHFCPYRQ
jgi:hypothetical protein